MDDYISRQTAIDKLRNNIAYMRAFGCSRAITLISELPSADVAPVRHGHWVASDEDGFVCSICRSGYKDQPTLMGKPMFDYCPVCGARMDGET